MEKKERVFDSGMWYSDFLWGAARIAGKDLAWNEQGNLVMKDKEPKKEGIDQSEPQPLSEIPALGRHVIGTYYLGLKDAGIIGYGEESKAIGLVMKLWP